MSKTKYDSLTDTEKEKLAKTLKNELPEPYQDLTRYNVLKHEYDFYPGWICYEIGQREQLHGKPLIALVKGDKGILLDWNPQTVYTINQEIPLNLTVRNVCKYLEFFFQYTRVPEGRMLIVNNSDHFQWREEPPLAVRKTLASVIQPAMVVAWDEDENTYEVNAFLMFKNHLFNALIQINHKGIIEILDRSVQVEDMPLISDLTSQ
jgi:hypothetical protein